MFLVANRFAASEDGFYRIVKDDIPDILLDDEIQHFCADLVYPVDDSQDQAAQLEATNEHISQVTQASQQDANEPSDIETGAAAGDNKFIPGLPDEDICVFLCDGKRLCLGILVFEESYGLTGVHIFLGLSSHCNNFWGRVTTPMSSP